MSTWFSRSVALLLLPILSNDPLLAAGIHAPLAVASDSHHSARLITEALAAQSRQFSGNGRETADQFEETAGVSRRVIVGLGGTGIAAGIVTAAVKVTPLGGFLRKAFRRASLRESLAPQALAIDAAHPPPVHRKAVDYTMDEIGNHASNTGGIGAVNHLYNLFSQYSVRMSGNYMPEILPQAQIAIREKTASGAVWASPLGENPDAESGRRLASWNWTEASRMARKAVVRLLHPYTQYEYPKTPQGTEITIRRFSPLLPDKGSPIRGKGISALDTSSLPVESVIVEAFNDSAEAKEVSVMLSMPNIAGWGTHLKDPYYVWDKTSAHQTAGYLKDKKGQTIGILMGANQSTDASTLGQIAVIARAEDGATISAVPRFNVAHGASVWKAFAEQGDLTNAPPEQGGPELAGAVCIKVMLQPGERRQVHLAISTDFPNDLRNEHTTHPRYTGILGPDGKPLFSASGKNAAALAGLALANQEKWSDAVDAWQAKILANPKLADHVKTMLINELYFLVAGGTIFTDDGQFYLMEGWDPQLLDTSDVAFYNPMVAEMMPEVEKTRLRQMARGVLWEDKTKVEYHGAFVTGDETITRERYGGDEVANAAAIKEIGAGIKVPGIYKGFRKVFGAVPHSMDDFLLGMVSTVVGNPTGRHINRYLRNHNTWKDLSPKFVLMLWRAYVKSGHTDKAFLNDTWSALQASLAHQKTFVDDTGLPVHQGYPDWTYDTWPVKGYSTYTAILTMDALKAAIAIGHEIGKTDAELQPYYDWLALGRKSIETILWNKEDGYFYISVEKNKDGTLTPNKDVMADAMLGELYAKLYGLEESHPENPADWRNPMVAPAQLKGHMDKVYDVNFKQFHGGKVGVVNGAKPTGEPIGSVGGDVQAGEVWLRTQRAVAVLFGLIGRNDRKREILEVDYQHTWNDGFQDRSPEAYSVSKKGDIVSRFNTYMGPGALFMELDAERKELYHKPLPARVYPKGSRRGPRNVLLAQAG